ncbi:MAG: ABC transporter permease [Polyangiaceae bacterium]
MNFLIGSLAVSGRILRELWRGRRTLVFWAIFPALMLILFGLIYAGGTTAQASFARTAPKILIGAALFFSCLGGPVATLVSERENGTLRRLLLSPLSGSSYFCGILLAFLVVGAGQTAIVCALAAAFGARFHGSVVLGLLVIALSVASYAGFGFFFGARLARRTEDVNGPIAAFGVPLLVLAGTFFPVKILPPSLLRAAEFDPIFHMNEALLALGADGAGYSAIAHHLWVLVAFAILSMVLGVVSYRQLLRSEQVQG